MGDGLAWVLALGILYVTSTVAVSRLAPPDESGVVSVAFDLAPLAPEPEPTQPNGAPIALDAPEAEPAPEPEILPIVATRDATQDTPESEPEAPPDPAEEQLDDPQAADADPEPAGGVEGEMPGTEAGGATDGNALAIGGWTHWRPNAEQSVRLSQMRMDVSDAAASARQARKGIKERIARAEVQTAARDFILDSDGGREGVIRTFDISSLDTAEARDVLARRYGVTFERRAVAPRPGTGFLNAVQTSEGTYSNVTTPGVYDVFVLSPKAVSMMAALELTELRARGFDPLKSRVREIKFSMDRNTRGELDLVVRDMRIERVR